MSVDDASLGPKVASEVILDLDVNILGSVEVWWPTWTDAVCAEGVDSSFLDLVVVGEVVVIVSCEIGDGFTGRELGLGSRWSIRNELALVQQAGKILQLHRASGETPTQR